MKKYRLLAVLALIALIIWGCGQKASETAQTTPAPAPVEPTMGKIDPKLVKGWMIGLMNRRPGIGAKSNVALGEGALGIQASPNAVAWFENVDIDSNGTTEKVGFMWDGTSKVIYAYTHDPVTLTDGSMADKGLLVGQYGEGNTQQRTPATGFWAYAITRDTTDYRETEGALYGCRFDQYGEETECGAGTWSRVNNEFSVKTKVQ
jgi:hypothetical protein